jgi:hypothetical protein
MLKHYFKGKSRCGSELNHNPVSQAAARDVNQAAGSIRTVTHSLGLYFYAAATIGDQCLGYNLIGKKYAVIAEEVCAHYTAVFRDIAVGNEPNLVKCKWNC